MCASYEKLGTDLLFLSVERLNWQRAAAALLRGKKLLPVNLTSQREVISELRQEADKRAEKEHSLLFFF